MLAAIRNFGGDKAKLKKVTTPEKPPPGMAAAVTEGDDSGKKKSSGGGGGVDLMADLKARLNRRRSGIGGGGDAGAGKADKSDKKDASSATPAEANKPTPVKTADESKGGAEGSSNGVSVDTPSALSNMQGLHTAISKRRPAGEDEGAAEWSDDD